MLDEKTPDAVVSDDLPRPPAGRRSATRPAGPPAIESAPLAPALIAAPELPALTSGTEAQPAKARPSRARRTTRKTEDAADPAAPAAPPSDEVTARPRKRLVSRRKSTEAPKEPTSASPELFAAAPNEENTGEEPVATPEPKTRRRGSRSTKTDTAPLDLDSVLNAVETGAASTPRKATRRRAADLLGDDVPTDESGEVDTGMALASLVASIAAQVESSEEDEDKPKPKRRGAKKKEPGEKRNRDKATEEVGATAEVAPATEITPDSKAVVADTEPGDTTTTEESLTDPVADSDEEKSTAESTAGEHAAESTGDESSEENPEEETRGARRRRRRGGRRRRRSGQNDDLAEEEADEGEADEGSEEPEATGEGARRRRRRRRRGSAGAELEDGELAVQVREPKALNDEISGIEGSTRLEAKKQRRREGRAAGRNRSPILSEAEFLARRESVDRVMLVREREDYAQLAVLEDDVLVEHYVDRSTSTSLIGNIYLGRVQNVLPSMEAVFIDIGRARNAVLYAGEVDWDAFEVPTDERKVEQVFKSGQSVIVQVSKDPVGAKGARLTGHISIPGRYVVFSPGGHLSGISRKLPGQERRRLKTILDEVIDENESVIVRTAAEGAGESELVADVERLKAQWQGIKKKAKSSTAPQALYSEPDLTLRIVRDTFTEDFSKLVVAGKGDENDAWVRISEYIGRVAPNLAERLVKWDEDDDPFTKFRIDEQISKALERKVFLPSGGSLVIDRTEAMTVIDVNTGKFTGSGGNLEETITKNNLEAAEEIVRQLRLRDLGGIIVIDFIDMVLPSNRELLLRRLVECLGRDRTRHQVSEVTSLGLVQMTRKRIGTGLAEAFTEECSCCGGRGYTRFDDPVESQAPADGGERRQKSTGKRGRRKEAAEAKESGAKAAKVHSSEEARKAASQVAAASRQSHTGQDITPGDEPEVAVASTEQENPAG